MHFEILRDEIIVNLIREIEEDLVNYFNDLFVDDDL